MLFHIGGNIDIKATLVSNINPAVPSKGMQVVVNQSRAAQASQFTDLVQMTLELAEHRDFTSIQSTQILIRVMSKILASHVLQGNFVTKEVISLKLEANSVDCLLFFLRGIKFLSNKSFQAR
jgi:hypothetical protein